MDGELKSVVVFPETMTARWEARPRRLALAILEMRLR